MINNKIKLIEEKTNENFVSKKNFLVISLAFIVTIALIACTIVFAMDIDFAKLFEQIKSGISSSLGLCCFFILLSYIPIKIIYTSYPILIRVHRAGIKVSTWEFLLYSTTICFLSAVTPANFVTDPYNVFWLKTHGFSNAKASSFAWSNAFLWHSVQMIITWPSFIIICMSFNQITTNPIGIATFWFIVAGIGIDMVILISLIFMGFSKHFHLYLSLTVNKIKKICKLSYHTVEETKAKYLHKAFLRDENIIILKDWKASIKVCLWHGIHEIIYYSMVYVSLLFILPQDSLIDFCAIFNITNAATTANKFIPIPGGEFTIQLWMYELLYKLGGIKIPNDPDGEVLKTTINNGILVWRTFTIYIVAIIGMFAFGIMTAFQIKTVKKNKKLFLE